MATVSGNVYSNCFWLIATTSDQNDDNNCSQSVFMLLPTWVKWNDGNLHLSKMCRTARQRRPIIQPRRSHSTRQQHIIIANIFTSLFTWMVKRHTQLRSNSLLFILTAAFDKRLLLPLLQINNVSKIPARIIYDFSQNLDTISSQRNKYLYWG